MKEIVLNYILPLLSHRFEFADTRAYRFELRPAAASREIVGKPTGVLNQFFLYQL